MSLIRTSFSSHNCKTLTHTSSKTVASWGGPPPISPHSRCKVCRSAGTPGFNSCSTKFRVIPPYREAPSPCELSGACSVSKPPKCNIRKHSSFRVPFYWEDQRQLLHSEGWRQSLLDGPLEGVRCDRSYESQGREHLCSSLFIYLSLSIFFICMYVHLHICPTEHMERPCGS